MVQVKKKPTKDKKTASKVKVPSERDQAVVKLVKDMHKEGVDYRDKFKNVWTHIESQIRCQHPEDWSEKEDWQSKVFIPQQAKTSETAYAYLDKILFGQPAFYDIQGIEKRDKEKEGHIKTLISAILQGGDYDQGAFYFENEFILKESVDIGTAFLKITVNPNRKGLVFSWRSPFYLKFDPSCGHNFYKSKWKIDEYRKPLQEIIDSVNSPYPIYSKERVSAMLEMMASECSEVVENEGEKALVEIKSFDGTQQMIPSKYMDLSLAEYWGPVKVAIEKEGDDKKKTIEGYKFEDRIVTVVNDKFLLRDDPNPYGFHPFFICRTKLRKYDTYGLGFCENSIDLQDLMNSMVNLGFDSLKICSMDIAMIDERKVSDKASIEYKPMAMWRFKDNPREAVQLSRQGISALGDIIRGITVLDQFQQEASGVLRQIQGAEAGGSTTLGEYNAKLAMADNRFLKVARMIEKDYVTPLIRGVFKIVFNPQFFNQELINRIIGVKEVQETVIDPNGMPVMVPSFQNKIDFNEIAQAGDSAFDFKALGMTQFVSRLELMQKLKELLIETVKTPQLMVISKIDEMFKRVLQAAEIPDFEELVKSDEEIKGIMNQIYGSAQQPQGAPGVPPQIPQETNMQMGVM